MCGASGALKLILCVLPLYGRRHSVTFGCLCAQCRLGWPSGWLICLNRRVFPKQLLQLDLARLCRGTVPAPVAACMLPFKFPQFSSKTEYAYRYARVLDTAAALGAACGAVLLPASAVPCPCQITQAKPSLKSVVSFCTGSRHGCACHAARGVVLWSAEAALITALCC